MIGDEMNYPGGQKKEKIENYISYANRGMTLENDLNLTNEYYRLIDKAYIYKKPTPIKITKVDYPSRSAAVIKEAYFEEPSTTDYNGIYNGMYIDFEAKETNSKTSFPLDNIHKHQIKHIENIIRHNGIAFIIVRFNKLDLTFYLKGEDLILFINSYKRKSIPLNYFQEKALVLRNEYQPRIDYLKIIDSLYGGKNK